MSISTAGVNGPLGQQQFMQLLVAQIQHQDPLEPIKNQDFLAQLAQFSTLESMDNLNSQFSQFLKAEQLSQAAGLLGQTITYGEAGHQGVVEELRIDEGNLELRVGQEWISAADIRTIIQP